MKYTVKDLEVGDAQCIAPAVNQFYNTSYPVMVVQNRINSVLDNNNRDQYKWVLVSNDRGQCVCVASVSEWQEMCFDICPTVYGCRYCGSIERAISDHIKKCFAPKSKMAVGEPCIGTVVFGFGALADRIF